jgi:hypothetical protein
MCTSLHEFTLELQGLTAGACFHVFYLVEMKAYVHMYMCICMFLWHYL